MYRVDWELLDSESVRPYRVLTVIALRAAWKNTQSVGKGIFLLILRLSCDFQQSLITTKGMVN